MPAEQSFGGQWLVVVARGIEHHLDDAFDVAVCGLQRADIHAEPPGDGRAHLPGVEILPLDLAALQYIGGESLQDGFLTEVKSQRFHVPDQAALPVTH
jgi:hypothetical protein